MKTPDIEIYLKHANADTILKWLNLNFDQVNIVQLTQKNLSNNIIAKGHLTLNQQDIPIIVTPQAAGKAFSSIWFKSNKTPWQNDESCAVNFLANDEINPDTEIRCSSGGWTESEEKDSEQWLSITREEKRLIRWG